MRNFRFIHCADLHLDSPFRGMEELPPAVADQVKRSTFLAFDRMLRIALDERVQAVIVAGDVYDLADRSLRAQLHVQAGFARMAEAGVRIFVAHGNHDPADGRRARLALPEGVHVFSHDEVETVGLTDAHGHVLAEVTGYSYPTAAVRDNLVSRYAAGSGDVFRIAVLHANLDGESEHDDYAPCTLPELIRSGFDYWALGHIHTSGIRHAYPHVVYPGNIQGRHIRETGEKGCYLVEVGEDRSVRMSFRETDALRWHRLAIPIDGVRTEQELHDLLAERLSAVAEQSGGRPAVVRVEWTGRGPAHRWLTEGAFHAELLQHFRDQAAAAAETDGRFVWIESGKARTGLPIDLERLLAEDSFLGDMLRHVQRLLADERQLEAFAEEAWEPLLANPRLAKLVREELRAGRRELMELAREIAADALIGEEG